MTPARGVTDGPLRISPGSECPKQKCPQVTELTALDASAKARRTRPAPMALNGPTQDSQPARAVL